MTTLEAVNFGLPCWMALAMPEDLDQIKALADLEYHTPHQRRIALVYYARCLRRDQWDRHPSAPVHRPHGLRPSKVKMTGYRTNPVPHRQSRLLLEPQRRAEIARKGARARWTKAGETSSPA